MRPGGIRCIAMGLLVGCYSPTLPENQPCSETQNCPEGLACDLASNECVSEVPEPARFVSISAFADHACGIDRDGALWCWGRNLNSALGLGDFDERYVPTRVGLDSDWIAISAGEDASCGIREPDQLFCWGDNLENFASDTLNPRQVPGSYASVFVGHDVWCAITTEAQMVCRRRGQDPIEGIEPIPSTLEPVQVSAQHNTTCAIDTDANLWCWGDNRNGQVGNGDANDVPIPASAPHQINGSFTQVEIGDSHVCALHVDGRMSCWGACQNAIGRSTDCQTPTLIDATTYTRISAGIGHTCGIRTDGKLQCFGQNFSGQLGAKGGLSSSEPLEIELFGDWTAIEAAEDFTCALRGNDEAWCWGDNRFGQLGDDGGGTISSPIPIDPGPYAQVFAGEANGCAIRDDGTLWCWGANGFGQLGDGTTFERRRPTQIGTDSDWVTVAIERTYACGIRAPGTLWCWGNNQSRQLGIGGNMGVTVPTQVGIEDGWTEIAITDELACGVLDDVLQCWGQNRSSMPTPESSTLRGISGFGQFIAGLDPTMGSAAGFSWFQGVLQESPSIADWASIDSGSDHVCGLRLDGEIWCYGGNVYGQLGRQDRSTLVEAQREETNNTWSSLSAGNLATCMIATDGRLACTGLSPYVGLGEDESADTPTFVGTAMWKSISLGSATTCGVQIDGSLHCWGLGTASGRGDGKGGHESPTRVSPP